MILLIFIKFLITQEIFSKICESAQEFCVPLHLKVKKALSSLQPILDQICTVRQVSDKSLQRFRSYKGSYKGTKPTTSTVLLINSKDKLVVRLIRSPKNIYGLFHKIVFRVSNVDNIKKIFINTKLILVKVNSKHFISGLVDISYHSDYSSSLVNCHSTQLHRCFARPLSQVFEPLDSLISWSFSLTQLSLNHQQQQMVFGNPNYVALMNVQIFFFITSNSSCILPSTFSLVSSSEKG